LLEAEGAARVTLGHCTDELAYLAGGAGRGGLTSFQIEQAVARTGTISGAARFLGVDRKTLRMRRRHLS